uniref:NADH-ubiquinone oxidoreductase chain 3 n=1 Tax=Xerotyphlops vermicularis TaxID=759976 RepID=A0A5C1ZYR7_9SAUR|nr:NADH dehydrogenase subunit 3 [Xerotyphlops vermicularis]QEO33843.1 NADH dehydrogenase subunit 3 [Xerotyphlops vermicularis]
MNILSMTTISLLITIIIVIFNFLASNTQPNIDKTSPYECGFDPLGNTRTQMSIQFFLIAILFLIFDLEIALLLPLPWAMTNSTPKLTTMSATMILSLLTLGLVYEWLRGGLDWAK